MNVARRFLSRLFFAAILLIAGASGCTSNLETEPVNLPVPFSGALSEQTRVLVSKGPPLEQGLLFGHPSGKAWEVFDSSGRSVGVVTFELDTATEPVLSDGGRRDFTLTVCFSFDDGSSVCADRVAFVDFPLDSAPSVDPAQAFPGEPEASAVSTRGVASGINTSGTQLFVGSVNQTTDHRYVYSWVDHADGIRTFYSHDLCSWFIQGFIGF